MRFSERTPSDKREAAKAEPQTKDVTRPSRMTVLLVDDVSDGRDMYALYLQHVGVRTLTARDGRSALASVKAVRPDLIVLDLAMPGLTGWDVLREMKANPTTRDIPIVVLSGQRARDEALRSGADAYCEKPCLPDKLFGELMRVLYGSNA